MKITKTKTGYILEDPRTSTQAQALEQFVESLMNGGEVVEASGAGRVASLQEEKLSLECDLLRVKIREFERKDATRL